MFPVQRVAEITAALAAAKSSFCFVLFCFVRKVLTSCGGGGGGEWNRKLKKKKFPVGINITTPALHWKHFFKDGLSRPFLGATCACFSVIT